MNIRLSRFVLPAVLAASIPAAVVFAQTPGQGEPRMRDDRPSAETLTRLQDGRIAMIKEALKLNDAQLKLWSPVETQMRASFEARQQGRGEWRARRGDAQADRLSLPDRIDNASKRMADRAERMKAYADAFRPFYAALSDDQKAVAAVVLQQSAGLGRRSAHRWGMHRDRRAEEK
jgi:hypothetical protein